MPRVQVMTDGVACIHRDLAQKHRIRVVPTANIVYDGRTYIEGETIDATEAYRLLEKDPDRFVTSAINPGYLLNVYRELSQTGRDIIFITLSAALSAVFKTGSLAADLMREESPQTGIRVFNSRAVAGMQGLVVLAAARAAERGISLDEVAAVAEQARQKTGGLMLLDTLRYVYRTGRMSKVASQLVSMLSIKPVNRVSDEGIIELVDKVRKREDGLKRMLDLIKKDAPSRDLHFIVSHAVAPEMAQELSEQLEREFNVLSLVISEFSPVMGYGAGPGCIFVGYQPELGLSG